MTTASVREAVAASAYSGSTVTANAVTGSGTAVNDLLVVFQGVDYWAGSSIVTPTGTAGSWTSRTPVTGMVSTFPFIVAWTRPVTVAGAQTITVSNCGGDTAVHVIAYVLSSADSVSDAASTNSVQPATARVAPSVTPGAADDLLLCAWEGGYNNSGSDTPFTLPASMTTSVATTVTDTAQMFSAREVLSSSAATGTRTATAAGLRRYAAASIAILGGSGGGGSTPERAPSRLAARRLPALLDL